MSYWGIARDDAKYLLRYATFANETRILFVVRTVTVMAKVPCLDDINSISALTSYYEISGHNKGYKIPALFIFSTSKVMNSFITEFFCSNCIAISSDF